MEKKLSNYVESLKNYGEEMLSKEGTLEFNGRASYLNSHPLALKRLPNTFKGRDLYSLTTFVR